MVSKKPTSGATANPMTGETILRDDDGNETRILFTEEAVLSVEEALKVGIVELLAKATTGRLALRELQVLVWAGINGHRARGGATKMVGPERAMRVIRNCGGLMQVLPHLAEALTKCEVLGLPTDDDEQGDDSDQETDPTHDGA